MLKHALSSLFLSSPLHKAVWRHSTHAGLTIFTQSSSGFGPLISSSVNLWCNDSLCAKSCSTAWEIQPVSQHSCIFNLLCPTEMCTSTSEYTNCHLSLAFLLEKPPAQFFLISVLGSLAGNFCSIFFLPFCVSFVCLLQCVLHEQAQVKHCEKPWHSWKRTACGRGTLSEVRILQ